MPACECCRLMDGKDLEGACNSGGGDDRASNMETGRGRLATAEEDRAIGDAGTIGDVGWDWDWRGRCRCCGVSGSMPTMDMADKLGLVESGRVGNGGVSARGVAEKVARLLPSWAWLLERDVGREKLGADGEGGRGMRYKFPSRSIADSR
jgi:hypothetical protein